MSAKLRAEPAVTLDIVVFDAFAAIGQKRCYVAAKKRRRPAAVYSFQEQGLVLGSAPERNQLFGAIACRAGSAAHVGAEPQSPKRLEQAVPIIRCFSDIVGALVNRLDLGTLDPSEDQDSGPIFEKERKFTPVAILSGRQLARLCERGIEVRDRLGVGKAGGRSIAGTLVMEARPVGEAGAAEMIGQDFRLRLRLRGKSLLERQRDALVQHLTPAFEKTFISRVLHQRVFETVARIRRRAGAEQKLGVLQLCQRGLQRSLITTDNRVEKCVVEFASDRSADLGDLLRRPQTVKPRHQRILQ